MNVNGRGKRELINSIFFSNKNVRGQPQPVCCLWRRSEAWTGHASQHAPALRHAPCSSSEQIYAAPCWPRLRSASPGAAAAAAQCRPLAARLLPPAHRLLLAGLSNMEEREWGARSARAGSPASPPSPRLDVSSYSFDPLLALYAPRLPPIPYPNAPCFNNVAEYESFLKGGRTGRGRARGTGEPASAGTSTGTSTGAGSSSRARRRAAPTPDPERIQRLRRLMVVKEDTDGTAGARRQGQGRSKKAPRNVLTRMPCECWGTAGGLGRACKGRLRESRGPWGRGHGHL